MSARGITMVKEINCNFFFFFVPGYMSSPHIDQDPRYAKDAQHGPVITSPVVPAASPGKHTHVGIT